VIGCEDRLQSDPDCVRLYSDSMKFITPLNQPSLFLRPKRQLENTRVLEVIFGLCGFEAY